MEFITLKSGGVYQESSFLNKIPEFQGEHYWLIPGAWHPADPEKAAKGEGNLDLENMVFLGIPSCFFCDLDYSKENATIPCIPILST